MPARVLPRLIFANQLSTSFSALTLLVGRQEGHPACNKTEWLGAGVVICLERGAALHAAQLMPLPLTCFSKIRIGVTFLVPAHPGSPGQRAVKRVCVCSSGLVWPHEKLPRGYRVLVHVRAFELLVCAKNLRSLASVGRRSSPGVSPGSVATRLRC